MWTIEILAHVKKSLAKMRQQDAGRILKAIYALADDPFAHDIVKMKGREEWRLRVGGWRVLLHIDKGKLLIIALSVGPRGDAYK